MQNHLNKLQEKVGYADMRSGLFHKANDKNMDYNDINYDDDSETKLCAEWVSDKSSVMVSGLFHKSHDKSKCDNDVANIECYERK